MIPQERRFAEGELGGTNCVCILAAGPDDILAGRRVPTTAPAETLDRIKQILDEWKAEQVFAALGLASFGPLELRRDAANFGHITQTTKSGWPRQTSASGS